MLSLWKQLLVFPRRRSCCGQPSPPQWESRDSRSHAAECLLHPLFLEADEALVNHIHRQILVGQSCFHLIQDGWADWGRAGRSRGGLVSTGSKQPHPTHRLLLSFRHREPAWQHPPRSAATGLPLVTTNSYFLRDWSPSHPIGWRLERAAGWTSTTTANSVTAQTAAHRVLLLISLQAHLSCCSNYSQMNW